MKRTLFCAATLALSLGSTLPAFAASSPASATKVPGARIAWSQYADRHFSGAHLMTSEPSGKDARQLTFPDDGVVDLDPVWSPNHTQIAFERDTPDRADVFVIDADGSNEHMLDVGCVDPCVAVLEPSWSADGTRLLFTPIYGPFDQVNGSATSAVLWSANLDGSDLQRVSPPGIDGVYEDYHARYAPDGSYLVFVRVSNEQDQVAQFRMNSDGTHVRQLTPWDLNADTADLSQATSGPTKDLLVFESYGHGEAPPGSVEDVQTVPTTCPTVAQCSALIRNLTSNGAGPMHSNNPSWSPDGSHIAFVEYTAPARAHGLEYADIFSMNADGTDRHRVSRSPTWNFRPDW